jgi:predicted RNA methylase
MNLRTFRMICVAALAMSLGACTVLGVETDSTTTEVQDNSNLDGRVDRLESRLERLERRLDRHISR